MKKKRLKKLLSVLIACGFMLGSMLPVKAAEPYEVIGNVKPSDKAYNMILTDANNSLIRNKKEVDLTVGKRYFMTYTVDKVDRNEMVANGVVISQDKEAEYPYLKGMMHYDFQQSLLMEEGATYFYRIEVTEEGFSYVIAKMGKNDSHWIELPLQVEGTNEGCKYFGVWLQGPVSAQLSSILCYDENGNDLGVTLQSLTSKAVVYSSDVWQEKEVSQYYEFSLNNETGLAISNAIPTDSDAVYMSYRVENVQNNKCSQAGIIHTAAPKEVYPQTAGIINFSWCDEDHMSPLFTEGAEYLIYAVREGDSIVALVRRTLNGKEDVFAFPIYGGKKNDAASYFSIWHGYEADETITADIKEFRCYDPSGKNLGVQTNKPQIRITKYGNIEDYSYCEALYWCKDNETLIILDDECNARIQTGAEQTDCTYTVNGTKLTMVNGENEEVYDYYYGYMADSSKNRYVRLGDTKVTFETGIKDHEGNKIVTVTAADGYKVAKPEDPKLEGYTFDKWCLNDGTEFDFDQYVTESVTLYARFTDGDGHVYEAINENAGSGISAGMIIAICVSVLLIAATIIGIILIVQKTKKGYKRN